MLKESITAVKIIETKYVSERIKTVKIKENKETAMHVQIYVPCNVPDQEEEYEEFVFKNNLQETLNDVRKEDNIII